MRAPHNDRLVVIAPYLVAADGHEQFLSPLPAAMRQMVDQAQVTRLQPMLKQVTPEAAFLGVPPDVVRLAPGPLTLSALRHDPPSDSVQFHVTLMSVDAGGVAQSVPMPLATEDLRQVTEQAKRLDTPKLTFLSGEQTDHALVWEKGSLDLGITAAGDVVGKAVRSHLPEGDGELLLRRFIDDSIDLLDGLELNRRREGEGLAKLNLLWPWGFGFRTPVPNLALRRGEVATVHSDSMRLEGLARLAGYQHGNRVGFRRGVFASERALQSVRPSGAMQVVGLPGFDEIQRHQRPDEGAWALEQISHHLLDAWLGTPENPTEVLFVAPGGAVAPGSVPAEASLEGLAFHYRSWQANSGGVPFHPKIFDDQRVPVRSVWESTRAIMEP